MTQRAAAPFRPPSAPFTKPEKCVPLALRVGARGLRLSSRIPEGQDPEHRGVEESAGQMTVAVRARSACVPTTYIVAFRLGPPDCRLARSQYSLLRLAARDHDQFGLAPGSSRWLVHGLAPPDCGDGIAAALESSVRCRPYCIVLEGARVAASASRSLAPSSVSSHFGVGTPRPQRGCAGRRVGSRSPCRYRSGVDSSTPYRRRRRPRREHDLAHGHARRALVFRSSIRLRARRRARDARAPGA